MHKLFLIFICIQLLGQVSKACSCTERLTTEQEFKRSDLVIQGRIIGADTIYSSNSLVHDKRGIKVGKRKYSIHVEKFLRIKLVVEYKFRGAPNLPDTIFILTSPESTACGYPFTPFIENAGIPVTFYQFIIYGDKWIEKSVVHNKKGKRNVREIKETLLPDTFFTSICRRTQPNNEEELKRILEVTKYNALLLTLHWQYGRATNIF